MATRVQIRLALVLGLLVLSAVIVTTMGRSAYRVNLSAAMELWSDVLRDADDFGLQLTRVSAHDETELGDRIASAIAAQYGQTASAPYLTAVGDSLAQHATRKDISYKFHVIQSPEINAFAVPGGHVFITTGMLAFLHSEAELAGVLGHEISHIDLRHCIDQYQYQLALRRVGAEPLGEVVDYARMPMTFSYSKYQEAEADENGMTLAIEAGYDPRAMVNEMTRFDTVAPDPAAAQAQSGPATEAASATVDALGDYLRSHPLNHERIEDLNELIASDRRWHGSRQVYEGVQNYSQGIPMSQRRFPGETKTW
ncbi:MAG TPA: M48 family metalloprotease [Candidatus Binatus sp.]|nr:M48 family metalloprotease [Candidatus Binatus sp.]